MYRYLELLFYQEDSNSQFFILLILTFIQVNDLIRYEGILVAISPVITFPTTESGYSTNLKHQTIGGTADVSTTSILVNGSTNGVEYTPYSSGWSYSTDLSSGTNTFRVIAYDGVSYSSESSITISFTDDDNLNLIVSTPTGFSVERSKNKVKLSIVQNPEDTIIGYNFYGSESVGGGSKAYTLLNKTLITKYDYYKENTEVVSNVSLNNGDTRTTTKIEKVTKNYYYTYTHDRVNNPLGMVPLSEPNYYVVTAVAFDPVLKQQVESMYSSELPGTPLILDATSKEIQPRTTLDIQQTYIASILEDDSDIDVKPGTVTRDIHINPPSDEFARLYIIQNFFHISQSFTTLLEFDDADNDGVSDYVLNSTPKMRLKEALLISDNNYNYVQQIIDSAFEKLASNVNVTRKGAQKSLGQALFYTRKEPTKDVSVNAGALIQTTSDKSTSAVVFSVLTDFTMYSSTKEQYYNPTNQRYEFTLDIQAVEAGSSGNVDSYKINNVISGVDNILGVENVDATEFGQDAESNSDLAKRALLAFVGVDSGTEGGYLATTLSTPNVNKCKIISAGEDLMQRDLDSVRLVHTNGKIDIYIRGSQKVTYTENFGFTYATAKNERALIQSVPFFQFKVLNSSVTEKLPVYSVLSVKNVTKSANYDLTGFKIVGDGDVIDLDETLETNIGIGLSPTDIITVSYRYRDSDPFLFSNQPVDSIVSVTGEISGLLGTDNYILVKSEDPLTTGNSTAAENEMRLVYSDSVPSGEVNNIVDEEHILSGEQEVALNRYGVTYDSIIVTDSTNTTVYEQDIDYSVIAGDMRTYTYIKRTSTSKIADGATVLVDYEAGENFSVSYTVNRLLNIVQNKVDSMKHLTADVIVKSAITTPIDFDLKILLVEGSDQTSIDKKIRTAISKLLSDKNIGESIYQSDVVHTIESISGVDHVIIPFTKMVRSNGSTILRESYSGNWTEYQTVNVTTYKSVGVLSWTTVAKGAPEGSYSGVYENDFPLDLRDNLDDVGLAPGRAYISKEGYIYVSPKNSLIGNAGISVTYVVENATGTRDISFSEIEHGSVGTLVITYDFAKKNKGF